MKKNLLILLLALAAVGGGWFGLLQKKMAVEAEQKLTEDEKELLRLRAEVQMLRELQEKNMIQAEINAIRAQQALDDQRVRSKKK